MYEWEIRGGSGGGAPKTASTSPANGSILRIFQHTHLDVLNYLLCGSDIVVRVDGRGWRIEEPRVLGEGEELVWFRRFVGRSGFNMPKKVTVKISSSSSSLSVSFAAQEEKEKEEEEELVAVRNHVEDVCRVLRMSKGVSEVEIEPAGREADDPCGSYYYWSGGGVHAHGFGPWGGGLMGLFNMPLPLPLPGLWPTRAECTGDLKHTLFPRKGISDLELVSRVSLRMIQT